MAKRRNRKRSGGIARDDYTQGGRVGYREGEFVRNMRVELDDEEAQRKQTQRKYRCKRNYF